MQITNNHKLPDPVVRALSHDDYSRGASNRSVTQLIDSPRYRILKHEYAAMITKDASELVWIALGKGIHKMFEDYAGGKWNPEERIFAECEGWTISGQVDIQELSENADGTVDVVLYDYKVTSVWSIIFGKESYGQQLNFYRWLTERRYPNYRIVGLKIVFVLRDWKLRDSMQKADYPEAPIIVQDQPLWHEDDLDNYVHERVRLHQEAELKRLVGDTLPFCTDEERWKRDSKWAVKKPANKTARRVFSSFEEAEAYIEAEGLAEKGFEIEERPSEATRCVLGYCPVAEWCDQFRAELEEAA